MAYILRVLILSVIIKLIVNYSYVYYIACVSICVSVSTVKIIMISTKTSSEYS